MRALPVRTVVLSLSLLALGLAGPGCRPLIPDVPGCTEGADCTPGIPSDAPSARLTPDLPAEASSARITGRHLQVTATVSRAIAARELEILCGDRRLATWSVATLDDAVTLGAMVDLLPCWDGGVVTQPSAPFLLTLVVVDRLDARHAAPAGWVRIDPRMGEGEEAPSGEWPLLSLSPPRADGTFLLSSDQALASPPEAFVEGVRAQVLPRPDGWLIRPPRIPGLDLDGNLMPPDALASLEVRGTSLAGRSTWLTYDFAFPRELRPPLTLPGTVTAPFNTPGTRPVATPDGLVALAFDEATNRGLQVVVQPDGTLASRSFAMDTKLLATSFDCRNPFDTLGAYVGLCPLSLNAQGQLLAREAATGSLRLQRLPLLEAPTSPLEERMLDASLPGAAGWSGPGDWVPAGGQVCTEDRSSCAPGCDGTVNPVVAPRVCVATDGVATSEATLTPADFYSVGDSSTAVSTGAGFATHAYVTFEAFAVPRLGFGLPGGRHRWFAPSELPVSADFRVVGAGTGVALLPGSAPADASLSVLLTAEGAVQPYAFHQPSSGSDLPRTQATYVDASGRVTVIGTRPDGTFMLSRWAPGADVPDAQQVFSMARYQDAGTLSVSAYDAATALGRPLPGGGAVLVVAVERGSGDPAWLVLAVDAQLRPLWSSLSEGDVDDPPIPLPAQDGGAVWVTTIDRPSGDKRQVRFFPSAP